MVVVITLPIAFGQTLPETGFLVSFYEDDMSSLLLRSQDILHLAELC
jgi:hypothetical protein